MKQISTLLCFSILFTVARSQVVLNEIYTSPGAGNHEFFELYNSGTESTPLSVDGFSIVTYFESGSTQGFYVLDLPSLFIDPRGFFVGASELPFNYQGNASSTNANFSWNSPTLTANSGYLRKWVMTGSDASDGNISYNEAVVPANFNDFFYDKSGGGVNYSVFVFKNGILINSFYGGTSSTSQPSFITSMPDLVVNNVIGGVSNPFTIKFSTFAANQAEYVTPEAGTDNGYIRKKDGVCNTWDKSSSSSTHTPAISNGTPVGTGSVTISGNITRGVAPATTSTVTYDITAGTASAFPVELQVYVDNGSVLGDLDATDTYLATTLQTSLADGYSTISFSPLSANILVVAKTAAGCFGQVKLLIDAPSTLPVKLVSFSGTLRSDAVNLTWTVDMNETADKFEIERSVNGTTFSKVGTVSGTGTPGTKTYTFSDPLTTGEKVSYRLRMTDNHDKVEYSKIISFGSSAKADVGVNLMQNPVVDKLNINFTTNARETVDVRVVDITGSIRLSKKMIVQSGSNMLYVPLPTNMLTGTYVISVAHSRGMYNQKFIRQ